MNFQNLSTNLLTYGLNHDIIIKGDLFASDYQFNGEELSMTRAGMLIRQLRKEQGLSQEKLGEIVGVRQSQIANIETGVSEPSLTVAKTICQHFSISLDELFADAEPEQEMAYA